MSDNLTIKVIIKSFHTDAYRASDVMYGWEEEFIGDVIGVENLSHFTSKIRTGKFAITGMNLNESTLVFNKGKNRKINRR